MLRSSANRRRAISFAGRTLLWAALGLLLVRGTIDLFQPDAEDAAPPAANDASGDDAATDTGVDIDAAEAFAVRFATEYLTLDDVDPERRRGALQAFVATGVELDDTWDATGVQAVRDALPVTTTVGDDNRLMVLVAAQVDGGRWLHLAVPLAGDGQRFVVTALPALVSEPSTADVELAPAEVDPGLSAAVRPTVEGFLAAYGAGDEAALEPYVAPDLDLGGLGGSFVVDEVAVVEAVADTADTADSQTVRATVRWLDPTTGATFGASYSISLMEDDGRWYVEELAAAQG